MRVRGGLLSLIIATIVISAYVLVVRQNPPTAASAAERPADWTPSRTPDGQPDMQGIWTNYTNTPFEVFDEKDNPALYSGDPDGTGRGTGPGFLNDSLGRNLTKGRSLVVDPPSGRVPIMPWAEEKRNYRLAHLQDDWVNFTAWERCITRGVPGGIFPTGYGSGYQVLQGPGYVAIVYEMIHEARIIPVDGRTHVGSGIRLWNGDSRGRWEGNTLVVDTTNYSDKIGFRGAAENLHVTERFTRVAADTIRYEFTVDDPTTWTRSWSAEIPMKRMQGPLFEYACTEGNYGLMNILRGARVEDAKAEAAATANPN